MGLRKTGNFGQIYLPLNEGVAVVNAVLTLSASKTIQGQAYAKRFHGHASTHWNRGKGITLALQGLLGEASITPASGNDAVQTPVLGYLKDNTGAQTAAADTSVSVTRPASGKKNWNLVVLDMDDGTISAVAGTDGDAHSDVFDAAGGPPLVATDKIIIGGVKLSGNTAAPIAADEIVYSLSNGTLLQERADMPSLDNILPMEGGVLLPEALLECHTGGIPRKIYASFYSQKNSLAAVGNTQKWSLSGSRNTTEMQAQGDVSAQSEISGPMTWSGSMSRFAVDAEMFKLAFYRGTGFVKLFRDRNVPTEYYEGAVIISNWDENNDIGAACVNNLQFKGDGNLEWRGN